MADINVYKKQASDVYDPLLQSDTQQAYAKRDAALAGLDADERTVEPAYQTAVTNLGDQVRQSEGKINQLYSTRLMGNFSGLQANDAGMMYGTAARARSNIELTRANKLIEIAAKKNLVNTNTAGEVSSLTSKTNSQKAQYAYGAYNSAVTAETKAAKANDKTTKDATKDYAVGYKIDKNSGKNNGYTFTGPNKAPISMYQYAQATGNSMLDLLKNSPTQYDRSAYNEAMSMAAQGVGEDQILAHLHKKYSLLF